LTQSVELLLRESQEQTRQIIEQGRTVLEHSRQINEHSRQINEHSRQINEHSRQVGALRDASAALLQIVQHHENRISGLEGQP
jgi:methyl-accepting chemotaxis protein